MTLKRLIVCLAFFLILSGSGYSYAQSLGGINGDCTIGGQQSLTQGLASTATQQIGTLNILAGAGIQASFPYCTITVYLTGTSIKPPIYSNNNLSPSPLTNPFNANQDGSWLFFSAQICPGYDITLSTGGGPSLPYTRTLTDVCLGGSGGGGGGSPGLPLNSLQFNSAGTFAGSVCSQSGGTITCAGPVNVTGPVGIGAVIPGACGSAIGCIAFNYSSGSLTPTASQATLRFLAGVLNCGTVAGEGPCFVNGFPATAQVGDILRQNVNGDSAWDAVNATYKNTIVSVDTGTLLTGGTMTQTATGVGSTSLNNPNTTDGYSFTYSASASASTSTVLGVAQGTGGNASTYGWQAFYRWTGRWSAGNTTGERCWLGLGNYSITGTTQEAYAMLGTVKFATNNPQVSTLAFRYDEGTDTTWQAVAQIGGGSQTIVSTATAIDTNPHFFDITSAGGTANFFIDHALVATISTNVPTTTSGTGLGQGLFTQFWACDNEDVATAISAKFYWMGVSTK